MGNRSPWKTLVAEMGFFMFILLAIYAGFRFWETTMFSRMGRSSVAGNIFSYSMLILIILAMIPIFLLSLRRILLRYNVITKEDSRRYLWSRTWFVK